MSFSTTPSDGTVSSGFTQSLWLGLAAILVLFAVLYVTQAITRRCVLCCGGDKQRSRASSVILSDKDVDALRADEKYTLRQEEATAPLTAPRASAPTTTYGATDAAVPSSTKNQQATFASSRSIWFQKCKSTNATKDANYCCSVGAVCAPLTHPYNVQPGELSVEATACTKPFFRASVRQITNLPQPVCSEECEASLPVSFLSELQDADDLEEYRGHAQSQLTVQFLEDTEETYVVPPSSTEVASSAPPAESRADRLQALSINTITTSKCATQNPKAQLKAHVSTSAQPACTPLPPPAAVPLASSPTVFVVPLKISGENVRPLNDSASAKSAATQGTCSCGTTRSLNISLPEGTEEGGETEGTEHGKLQHDLQKHKDELTWTQAELSTALAAKVTAEAERQRICDEVRDMERYKGTLDGIIAFTLRELEDAAAGVEEAEEQMRRECAAASRKMAAAQEELRVRSLLAWKR